MNYDPIHDTYTGHNPEKSIDGGENGIHMNGTGQKALSISNLVSPPSVAPIASIINEENEFSEANGDAPKRKKRKYTNSTVPKCRNLKKADGEPFWRSEIQHDFLQELFDDQTPAFTNQFEHSDIPSINNGPKLTFAELYIRTLAESSKCSKILRERLIRDPELGKAVAKVCLLVNAGRMNTTINFVPEMRSTLRTYHSIPSLQAGPKGTRPLQDTPRLKSILKAVCENQEVVGFNELLAHPKQAKPNTNVVQLVFYLSGLNQGIPHFDDTFLEFFLNRKVHPRNRAKRLLWLLYTYLETSFTPEEIAANPFGAVIPPLEFIDEDKLGLFDKDTEAEIAYSEEMQKTRLNYLADEDHINSPKRGNKSKKDREGEAYSEDESHDESFDEDAEAPQNDDLYEPKKDTKKKPEQKKRKLKKAAKNHVVVTPSPLSQNVITATEKRVIIPPLIRTTDFIEKDVSGEDFLKSQSLSGSSDLDHIHFPLDNFEELLQLDAAYLEEPTEENSLTSRLTVVEMSKPIIQEVRTSSKASTASFNKKTLILGNWLYRYFAYKRSIGNKLLGIEWEDIRYDLVNGMESYIYTHWGQVLSHAQDTGNSADGFSFWPVHDYDSVNEKISFTLQLISFCNDWFVRKLRDQKLHTQSISFDLENDVVVYN